MDHLGTWLPIVLGGIVIVAISYKLFRDPAVNNYIGYAFIAAVVLCALPTIQNLRIENRVLGVKAEMQKNVSSQSADLGGGLTDLNKKLDIIIKKINANPEAQSTLNTEYKDNKLYQVLVFYGSESNASEANKVRDFLLDLGYRSSATYTDFSGGSMPNENTIRLVFTKETLPILISTLKTKLKQKFPTKVIQEKSIEKMNSGDVQVQLL
jgi:hypothetical protein